MMKYLLILSVIFFCCAGTKKLKNGGNLEKTRSELLTFIQNTKGAYAVAYKDLQTGNMILINENEVFHAASTMKTPVMIEIYKQAEEGKFSIMDSTLIRNEFKSIVDGSSYSLNLSDDSDPGLYKFAGKMVSNYELINRMITMSSNLATNLLIEKVGAKNVTGTMRSIGAEKIMVLRGVEDGKAYQAGLNNTTTAFDLMVIFESIALNKHLKKESCEAIIKILLDQKFNDRIPALLPRTVKVAHKTGSITSVEHDSGILYLPDGRKYVLVCLSKNLPENNTGGKAIAKISQIIYQNLYEN